MNEVWEDLGFAPPRPCNSPLFIYIRIWFYFYFIKNFFFNFEEEKGKAKATLEALKFIEELLADDSSKKDDKEGVQTLKNETQRLKENSQTKVIKQWLDLLDYLKSIKTELLPV